MENDKGSVHWDGTILKLEYPSLLVEAGKKVRRARACIAGQEDRKWMKAVVATFAGLNLLEYVLGFMSAMYSAPSFALVWQLGLVSLGTILLVQILWWIISVHVFFDRDSKNFIADILTVDAATAIVEDHRCAHVEGVETLVAQFDSDAFDVLDEESCHTRDWSWVRDDRVQVLQVLVNQVTGSLERQGAIGYHQRLSYERQLAAHRQIAGAKKSERRAKREARMLTDARDETDEVKKT